MWRVRGGPEGDWGALLMYRERGLKVNADKSKVMVLGGEEGLGCEIRVDGSD